MARGKKKSKKGNQPGRGNKGPSRGRHPEYRTLKMMNGYAAHRAGNMSIAQIADLYGLSQGTVYRCLDEISKIIGCERDDLLYVPHNKHTSHAERNGNTDSSTPFDALNSPERLNARIDAARQEIQAAWQEILTVQENIYNSIEDEEKEAEVK